MWEVGRVVYHRILPSASIPNDKFLDCLLPEIVVRTINVSFELPVPKTIFCLLAFLTLILKSVNADGNFAVFSRIVLVVDVPSL